MTKVLITGASRGIGQALALEYAKPGNRVVLIGRSVDDLNKTAALCRERGAEVEIGRIDVRDREALKDFIEITDEATPVDLVIANAGITGGTPQDGVIEQPEVSRDLIDINLVGVLNTVQPLIPRMLARRRGHIVMISSIAGIIPLPDSPSYCASKAAVLSYGRAIGQALGTHGVVVSVACAGFVETGLSARLSAWKPGMVTPERAAQIIARGLSRKNAVVYFPWWLALLAQIGALLPRVLFSLFLPAFRFTVSSSGEQKGFQDRKSKSST